MVENPTKPEAEPTLPALPPSHSNLEIMEEHFDTFPATKRQRTSFGDALHDAHFWAPRLDDSSLLRMSPFDTPPPIAPSSLAASSQQQYIHESSSASLPVPSQQQDPPALSSHPTLSLPSAPHDSSRPEQFSHMTAEEYATYETCVAMQESLKAGKASANNYGRHIAAYERYWLQYQHMRCNQDASHLFQPPHPITATKVAIFLKYESERPKHTSSHDGGTVGIESIKQCISALERHRSTHQHELAYSQCEESQRPLRTDARIKQFEISKKASEPERIMSGEKSKAAGTSSDTYTVPELKQSSMWCLKDRKTVASLLLGVRDRCMLLLSTNAAFRGDTTRSVLFSDLSMRDVPMPELSDYTSGVTAAIEALVVLRDQGKHNQKGRVEEHAAFRHRDEELCCIGAVALYMFVLFHVVGREVPDFSPDFSDPTSGDYGRRHWYVLHMFPGKEGDGTAMSYKQQLNRVNLMHARNNIIISAKTHAGRKFTVKNIRDNRASRSEAKAVGRWSESGDGAYDRYDRSLPIEGMLAAASFNGRKPEAYMIPRNCLEPPPELVASLFPWVEEEQEKMRVRRETLGARADDYALKGFLDFLIRARRIVLQDAAVLFHKHPTCSFFAYAPFNTPTFRAFASSSCEVILDVEQRFRENMKNLPTHVANTFRGVINTYGMEQQTRMDRLDARFSAMESLLAQVAQTGVSGSRKRKVPPAISIPPIEAVPEIASTSSRAPSNHHQCPLPQSSECSHRTALHQPEPVPSNLNPTVAAVASTSTPPSNRIGLHTSALQGFQPGIREIDAPTQIDVATTIQDDALKTLYAKYGRERVARHEWDWIESTTAFPARFLPRYLYTRKKRVLENGCPKEEPLSVDDIWQEHVVGLDGHLSIALLNDGWGGSWKRNIASEKSEGSRRGKLVALIEALRKRPNWTASLALQFLRDRYPIQRQSAFPHLRSTRNFMEWLQRTKDGNNFATVIDSAASYHGKE